MKKLFTFIVCVFLTSLFIVGCKKEKPEFENHREVYKESQLYLGIVGFNEQLDFCKVSNKHFVPVDSENDLKSFVAGLNMRNGTVLYYAVDSALNWLEAVEFPTDLTNVSLITFTDGLDQGSTAMNPKYESRSDYLDAMNYRIRNEKIGNTIPINAYSIGVKGSDVMDEIQFKANLTKLASNILNVYEVTDMDAVNINFKRIARQIRASITPDMSVQIIAPDNNTKIRFTFDDVKSASLSTCYIEGVYSDGILTDIKTVGCTCDEAGIKTTTNGIHRTIIFPDLKAILGTLKTTNIRQWDWSSNIGGWQINSEFNPQTELKYRKTSVIMLVLDCSSSLGSNFSLIKNSVNEFIAILSGSWSDYSIPPLVQTTGVSEIKANSATVAGMVSDDGDASVTDRGVCWGTNENPTISNSFIKAGTGMGNFSANITGLREGTTYYVRAYATNSKGTAYGSQVTFKTSGMPMPTVTTSSASNITATGATLGGNVTADGGATVTERGVCWSTSTNPTISSSKKAIGSGTGSFSSAITDLTGGTTYYVRAYATNSKGTVYGEQVTFKTLETVKGGAIQVAFSVSNTKKVYFSQGNLQYQASTNTWRFAEHQYDMIGDANKNTYSGWIDLFGWGTSGYNSKYPYMTSISSSDYVGGGYADIAGTNYDWGVYNKISNGGNTVGMWRTLTSDEWYYVLEERADASSLKGLATVNGVTGLILLPDNWTTPKGITFKSGMNGFGSNTYSTSEWSKMEVNGAVFLPAAGERIGTVVYRVGSDGNYWSSTARDYGNAGYLDFLGDDAYVSGNGRYRGLSVRLVRSL